MSDHKRVEVGDLWMTEGGWIVEARSAGPLGQRWAAPPTGRYFSCMALFIPTHTGQHHLGKVVDYSGHVLYNGHLIARSTEKT